MWYQVLTFLLAPTSHKAPWQTPGPCSRPGCWETWLITRTDHSGPAMCPRQRSREKWRIFPWSELTGSYLLNIEAADVGKCQPTEGTRRSHCSQTPADCQESHGLVTDGHFFFFLISIKKEYRQGQRFRQILAHSSQRPRHNVGGMLGATVGLGQGSVGLGFAQTICWSVLESFMPRLALAGQLSIWAAFSVTKKTRWPGVILRGEGG